MEPQSEKLTHDVYELDQQAWNLPRPTKLPENAHDPSAPRPDESKSERRHEAA